MPDRKFRELTDTEVAGRTPDLNPRDEAQAKVRNATASEINARRLLAALQSTKVDLREKVTEIQQRESLRKQFQQNSDWIRANKAVAAAGDDYTADDVVADRFDIYRTSIKEMEAQLVNTDETIERMRDQVNPSDKPDGDRADLALTADQVRDVKENQLPAMERQLARLEAEYGAVGKVYDDLKALADAANERRTAAEAERLEAEVKAGADELQKALDASPAPIVAESAVVESKPKG